MDWRVGLASPCYDSGRADPHGGGPADHNEKYAAYGSAMLRSTVSSWEYVRGGIEGGKRLSNQSGASYEKFRPGSDQIP